MSQLPYEYNINVRALSRLFSHTTNSYKFIYFQALLSLFQRSQFKKERFSFYELEQEMINLAEYPINVFRLNFGSQDQLSEKIIQGKSKDLMKYVPYRLLTPFFEAELRGLKDGVKNKKIELLSQENKQFNSIYKIKNESIELYTEWVEYLKSHYTIIEGWAFWHWVNYLQSKNPNALALVNKLQKPSIRTSLSYQTKYWKIVLDNADVRCIFSNKPIRKNDVSLDHFLPWSFIGHDQLWNLIPVSRRVNSSKSDNIPNLEHYLEKLIKLQLVGLKITHENMSKRTWENQVDDFVLGLNVDFVDLVSDDKKVREKYKEIIQPLANVAYNMGFNRNWVFNLSL